MKNYKMFFLALCVAAGAVACGNRNSIRSLNQPSLQRVSAPNGKVLGRWTAGCKASEGTAETSTIANYEFGGDGSRGSVSMDAEIYASKTCVHSKMIARARMLGRYNAQNGKLTLNFKNAKPYSTFYEVRRVANLKKNHECNSTDWQVGVERESCVDTSKENSVSQYKIQSNVLTLYTGTEHLTLKFVR